MKDIRVQLLKAFPELINIHRTTIAKAMKTVMNHSYKKVANRFLPASTQDNKQQHKEAAIIVAALRRCKVKLCYIDEYNVSE